MRAITGFVAAAGLLFAGTAPAQTVYKWVDEDGEVHYSQTLPPERSQDKHSRLTSDGMVAEELDRVRTEEERAALEAERARQREAAERQRLAAQQDRLFLAAFPTEAALRRSYRSRREQVEAERRSVQTLRQQARTRFSEALQQAAGYERRGDAVPAAIATRIGRAREGGIL